MFSPDISGISFRLPIASTSFIFVLHEKSITVPKARTVMLLIFNARYRKVMYLISKSGNRCLVNPSTAFHAFPCRNITEESLVFRREVRGIPFNIFVNLCRQWRINLFGFHKFIHGSPKYGSFVKLVSFIIITTYRISQAYRDISILCGK